MAEEKDDCKLKTPRQRTAQKKPDRELYVPRHRKQTVKSTSCDQKESRRDKVAIELLQSENLSKNPGQKGDIQPHSEQNSPLKAYEDGNVSWTESNLTSTVQTGSPLRLLSETSDIAQKASSEIDEGGELCRNPSDSVTERNVKATVGGKTSTKLEQFEGKENGASLCSDTRPEEVAGLEKSTAGACDESGKDLEQNMGISDENLEKDGSITNALKSTNLVHGGFSDIGKNSAAKTEETISETASTDTANVTGNTDTASKDDGEGVKTKSRKSVGSHRKIKVFNKQKKGIKAEDKKESKELMGRGKDPEKESGTATATPGDTEDDWFNSWDETGNCINDEAKDELAKLTEIKDPVILEAKRPEIDYLSFQTKTPTLDSREYHHLTEIYDFSPDLTTTDISLALQAMGLKGFDIKWVDDTHAIGVFSTALQAQQAVATSSLKLKIRPVSEGCKETQQKTSSFKDMLLPYKSRPETTAAVARNLVTSALGVRTNASKEQRAAERQKIIAAKEKKKLKQQIAKETWGD